MSGPFRRYRSLLNERTAVLAVGLLLLFLQLLGQVTFLGLVLVLGLVFTLLIQLEIKRRMENLSNRRSEVQQQKSERTRGLQLLRAHALNSLPSPILLIGQDHKIVFANEAARILLGTGIVGEDVFLYLRQPHAVQAIDQALAGQGGSTDSIRYTTSKDRSFDMTIAPISADLPEEETQAMVFFYEVTSLLRTERMRVDFVANASHELRTPLSSLMGSIETLLGPAQDDPEAQQRFLQIMQKEAERMARLIDDLLSLSRIEMSRHVPPSTTVDVSLIVGNAISTVLPIARRRDMQFSAELLSALPKVRADEDQITQVVLNLLVNASKYADQGTIVHISGALSNTGKHVILSIRDEGPGIAAEHLARLTERFYRVDTARSRKMGGTGLGLAIVKHILLRHESQLDIRSQLGKGTTFSFRLPIAAEKTPAAA